MAFDVEGARKAGYSDAEIASYLAAESKFDVEGARKSGYADSEIISHLSTGQKPPEKPGIGAKLADVVTGNLRKVESTEALPDWLSMPELNPSPTAKEGLGPGEDPEAAMRAKVGSAMAGPQEIVKILQTQFPGIKARQDEKGNYILQSGDGKEYAIKPGFRLSDIPRAAAAFMMFNPAARATTLPGMALAGGATQAVVEGSQAAAGGDFNPGDVAGAAALGPAAALVSRGVGAAAGGIRRALSSGQPAAAAEAATEAAAQAGAQAAPAAHAAPVVTPVTPMPSQQLAKTAAKAGQGSSRAREVLASQASPDAETVEAAKRLGIADNLQPDHVTTNQAYRELAQAVKSVPGSEARAAELDGLAAVAKRADDLITEIGGADDVADLGVRLKGQMLATQKELEDKADDLYGQVRQKIPQSTPVEAPNVLGVIRQRAEELGGVENLSPMEKRILSRLSPKVSSSSEVVAADPAKVGLMLPASRAQKAVTQTAKQPTYALLDDVRRDVGAVTSRAGPFKDADTGLAKRLYSAIADDQLAAAEAHGAADTYRAAQAAVRTRKGLEDDLVAIFGKALDRSLSPHLASSVGKLAAGDLQGLARIINATPAPLRREVVASGIQYALTGGAKKQAVNFASYARWYEGLRKNSPAYALVAKNLDEQSLKQLNDLYKVSKGISLASKERITTGRLQSVVEELKGTESLVQRLYGLAGLASKAATVEAGTTLAGVPGAGIASVVASALMKQKTEVLKAVDAVISSQDFMKLIAKYERTGTVDRGLVKRLSYSKAMKHLARTLKDKHQLSDPEQFILSALQAAREREGKSTPALPAPTVH